MGQHYKRYSKEEKMRLIMECRQSGLSDYQWFSGSAKTMSVTVPFTTELKNCVILLAMKK
jgi:hypothetical protein